MGNNKFRYYVGISCGLIDLIEFSESYMTEDAMNAQGVDFSIDGGDDNVSHASDECLSYGSIKDAVESYLFFSGDGTDHGIINIFEDRIDNFYNYQSFIIRKDMSSGMVKLVSRTDISERIDQLFGTHYDDNVTTLSSKFMPTFTGILDKIEGVCDDLSYLYFSSRSSTETMCVFREGGKTHEMLLGDGTMCDEKSKRNNFYYNDTVDNMSRWLSYNMSTNDSVGILVSTLVSNSGNIHSENDSRVFRKMYGMFVSSVSGSDMVNVTYLKPKEIMKHLVDTSTDTVLPPDEDYIYCNILDRDDMICGFDLV